MRKKLYTISGFSFLFLILSITGFNANGQCSHSFKKNFLESGLSPGFSVEELKYDVKYYFIDIGVGNLNTNISGSTSIFIQALEEIDTLVFEMGNSLIVDSVALPGKSISKIVHESGLLKIGLDDPLQGLENQLVRVFYRGGEPDAGFFSGLSNRLDFTYSKRVTYTLSEPFQASSWFPVKQDLSDKADSVRVHITVDSSLMAGSNGSLKRITDLGNGKKRYEWFSRYPIAYYLISFSVADYIDYSFYTFPDGFDDSILVQNFIYDDPEILNKEKEKIDATDEFLKLFSEKFGIYPFHKEKYGHSMAPMGGGMEHQTMTTLQNFNFDLVSHELGHQWFGDYVTCSSWQHIWINEGFASYCEYLAREFITGESSAVDWMVNAHGTALRQEYGSVHLTAEEALNTSRIFSLALSYKKGASIIHMLRYEIDDDPLFFQSLRTFLDCYKNSVAGAEEFLTVVNEVTGKDFREFFDQWYYGKGYPIFQAGWRQRGDSLLLTTSQLGTDPSTPFFKTHVDFELQFTDGSDTIVKIYQDKPQKSFSISIPKKISTIRLDPYAKVLMKSILYESLPAEEMVDIGPNPFMDSIYLSFRNYLSPKKIRITDMEGTVIYEVEIEATMNHELKLGYLSNGIYLLQIVDQDYKFVKKIMKI